MRKCSHCLSLALNFIFWDSWNISDRSIKEQLIGLSALVWAAVAIYSLGRGMHHCQATSSEAPRDGHVCLGNKQGDIPEEAALSPPPLLSCWWVASAGCEFSGSAQRYWGHWPAQGKRQETTLVSELRGLCAVMPAFLKCLSHSHLKTEDTKNWSQKGKEA